MKNDTKNIAEVFGGHAELYSQKYFGVDAYNKGLDVFCEEITQPASILDIGCGPGNLGFYVRQKLKLKKHWGTDAAQEMLHLAQEKNPDALYRQLNCQDILEIKKQFNGVLCGFVIPYLNKNEVLDLFSNIFKLLEEEGTFYLSGNLGEYKESVARQASTGKGPQLISFYYSNVFLKK
ncbi:MAG: class I SAM-dependent methyltransferase, partial [Schleiferiaceae bacterium]|nr:class I SAM-dependent methyltransferase [Schleiferiaceae bacterium]